jgi:hypothetical protein
MYILVRSKETEETADTLKRATFLKPMMLRTKQTDLLLPSYEVISSSRAKDRFFVFVVQIPSVLQMTVILLKLFTSITSSCRLIIVS